MSDILCLAVSGLLLTESKTQTGCSCRCSAWSGYWVTGQDLLLCIICDPELSGAVSLLPQIHSFFTDFMQSKSTVQSPSSWTSMFAILTFRDWFWQIRTRSRGWQVGFPHVLVLCRSLAAQLSQFALSLHEFGCFMVYGQRLLQALHSGVLFLRFGCFACTKRSCCWCGGGVWCFGTGTE